MWGAARRALRQSAVVTHSVLQNESLLWGRRVSSAAQTKRPSSSSEQDGGADEMARPTTTGPKRPRYLTVSSVPRLAFHSDIWRAFEVRPPALPLCLPHPACGLNLCTFEEGAGRTHPFFPIKAAEVHHHMEEERPPRCCTRLKETPALPSSDHSPPQVQVRLRRLLWRPHSCSPTAVAAGGGCLLDRGF